MKRHEAWRAEYRADRYLRDASIGAIERRSQDICNNMLNVNETGQLTAGMVGNDQSMFWWSMWTHILEELAIRQTPHHSAKLMASGQFPWLSHPAEPRGLKILGKHRIGVNDLVRLGQKAHIKDAINHGRFRISPAASYADPSLNPAIQDDELSVTAVRSADTAVIHTIDPATGKQGEAIPAIGEIQLSRRMEENFYVMCMTSGYEPRLLDDFGYDAMLVIKNVNRFIIRIEKAVKKVRPDLVMAGNVVNYYDPYRVKPDDLAPFYAKNFKYTYQREYRLIWYAPGLALNCDPFFVEIGPMKHIARIHVLNE